MSRVFLDSNLFIYLLEDTKGPRGVRAFEIFEALSQRGDTVMTSTLTLGEVLVKPTRDGDRTLAAKYKALMQEPEVKVLAFDRAAGEIFALIRQDRSVKAPDVIQLATAAAAGCDLFITNDDRLTRVLVPGIQFIASMQTAPL